MASARAQVEVYGTVAAAEALWYDVRRWPSFVEGFGHVVRADDEWPAGGSVVWDSPPKGRGRVIERVTFYEARTGQDVEVEDERLIGTQQVRFAPVATDSVAVQLTLRWKLKARNPLMAIVDATFIRRAQADALQATLARWATELESDRELGVAE